MRKIRETGREARPAARGGGTRRTAQPGGSRASITAVLMCLALLSFTRPAAAQFRSCKGIDSPGYKVLVDDIFDTAGGAASPLMPLLVFRIDANLEQLKIESGLPLVVIPCPTRRPSPADFGKSLVEQLNARQVALEIWGTTAKVTDARGAPYQEAAVGYALVPVRYDELSQQGKAEGAFLVARRATSVTSVDSMVKLVDQSGEIAAYVALSTGVKLLKSRDYDLARAQLCRAEAMLTEAAGPKPTLRDKTLIAYVQQMAATVVSAAKADKTKDSRLKLLPVTGSCR